jgi:toxin ParE1/3/4
VSHYRIARRAQDDLDDIWCDIGNFDLNAADRWLGAVEQRFKLLASRRYTGQARPELAPALRFLPVGNYLIFYRPIENGVEIARVIHGARDYGPDLF